MREYAIRMLELARNGRFNVSPNPMVGCILERSGEVLSEGWHHYPDSAHAEIEALKALPPSAFQRDGVLKEGTTAWVSLEPCAFHGRTPPCSDALIQARVSRVVIALPDPHPRCSGVGTQRMREAGIVVDHVEDPLVVARAGWMNRGYLSRQTRGRPWVTLKIAASMDGRTALDSGESQWISSSQSRADVQQMRANSCAILTGSGTVRLDDPSLLVRPHEMDLSDTSPPPEALRKQPVRVILGKSTAGLSQQQIFSPNKVEPVILFTSGEHPDIQSSDALEIVQMPADERGVDLQTALAQLGQRGCNWVFVEAGAKLNGAFWDAELIDELVLYQAPVVLGRQARPMLADG